MASKIIERHITNEDGDVYGVVGNLTRLGALHCYLQIKSYKKAQGLDSDPLSGRELTPMERFVNKGEDK